MKNKNNKDKTKFSIRGKLTLIIVTISMLTLIIASSLFSLFQVREYKITLVENLTAVAKITGDNVQAALAFDNAADATQILSQLKNDPRIITAAIFDESNELFSSYKRTQSDPVIVFPPESENYLFGSRKLHLVHPILLEGDLKPIGRVYIQISLDSLYKQLQRNLSITGIIILLSLIFCILLASRFQKVISNPILKLSDATDKIKNEKDFSIRVNHDEYLEIEHLCDGFNSMLDRIQDDEQQLLESHYLLERRVTERTEELEIANIELKEAKDAAETANKSKSRFLASMSHELRTPLNAIIGFTEMLQTRPNLEHSFNEYINIINQSGDHLLTLINDILDMAKIEAGKLELEESNIDLLNLLDSVISMLTLRAQLKDIHLITNYDSSLPQYVFLDATKLRQILINLLGNAIKFTEQGEINLTVSYKPDDDDKSVGKLIISVNDTGPGLKSEELDKLFRPFTQTESGRKKHGTGLGLTLSKNYIELMDGEIKVKSTVGKGTRFDFSVRARVVNSGEVVVTKNEFIRIASGRSNFKILIVEDMEFNRNLLFNLMQKICFETKEALNGLEAIRFFTNWQPDFIWMDILMPEMNGIEAMKKIREMPGGERAKIVAVTASGLNEDRQSILNYGFDDVLFKPYKEWEVYKIIEEQLKIEFTYDHDTDDINKAKEISHDELNKIFSKEELNKLLQTAIEGDIATLNQMVESIDIEHSGIREKLSYLTNNFEFEEIISILTPLEKTINQ